jgi:hypothetical protein
MGIALWVVQVLVAGAFVVSGATKLSQPKEKLLKKWAWVEDFSQPTVGIIGALRGRRSVPSNCRSRTGAGLCASGRTARRADTETQTRPSHLPYYVTRRGFP